MAKQILSTRPTRASSAQVLYNERLYQVSLSLVNQFSLPVITSLAELDESAQLIAREGQPKPGMAYLRCALSPHVAPDTMLARQFQQIKAIAYQDDVPIALIFVDLARPGYYKKDEPALTAALEAARRGYCSALYISRPDHLARRIERYLEIAAELQEVGVDLRTPDMCSSSPLAISFHRLLTTLQLYYAHPTNEHRAMRMG